LLGFVSFRSGLVCFKHWHIADHCSLGFVPHPNLRVSVSFLDTTITQ
jgi:hypothetical protein